MLGKTVRISAVVDREADSFRNKNFITLETYSPNVAFFIRDRQFVLSPREYNKPVGEYEHGKSYNFYVFISRIIPEARFSGYDVRSELIIGEGSLDMPVYCPRKFRPLSNIRLCYNDNLFEKENSDGKTKKIHC